MIKEPTNFPVYLDPWYWAHCNLNTSDLEEIVPSIAKVVRIFLITSFFCTTLESETKDLPGF